MALKDIHFRVNGISTTAIIEEKLILNPSGNMKCISHLFVICAISALDVTVAMQPYILVTMIIILLY